MLSSVMPFLLVAWLGSYPRRLRENVDRAAGPRSPRSNARRSARDDPHGPGAHDLAAVHGQRAVGEGERPADPVEARSRLDPVVGVRGLEEVDGQADGLAVKRSACKSY